MILHRSLLVAALLSAAHAGAAELPAPTGRFPVGRATFHWVDEKRPELETRAAGDRRELLVYVFHPSRRDPQGLAATYMPGAEAMRDVWKEDLTLRVTSLRAHSRDGVRLPKGTDRFPVVLFGPGGGQKALAYTALLEDLASHGYVVAAIERPYNAPATLLPDGRLLRSLSAAEQGWEEAKTWEDTGRIFEQKVAHWARDMSFVLDKLAELDAAKGAFARRLALDRVGAFGHSNGGQAAATVRLLDPRFRGAVNIDGNMRGRMFQPLRGAEGGAPPCCGSWPTRLLSPTRSSRGATSRGRGTRASPSRAIACWRACAAARPRSRSPAPGSTTWTSRTAGSGSHSLRKSWRGRGARWRRRAATCVPSSMGACRADGRTFGP